MSTRSALDQDLAEGMQEVIASAVLTNERIARLVGLSVVDFQAYGVLVRHDRPMTPGELAKITELPSSTTTRVLDRLQAKGLLAREPDPADRRKVWVHAKPLESPEVGAAYSSILRQMTQVHADFTVAELKVVLRYLRAVKDVR